MLKLRINPIVAKDLKSIRDCRKMCNKVLYLEEIIQN